MLRKMLPKLGSRANADDLAAMTAFYDAPAGALIWVTESGLSDKARAVIARSAGPTIGGCAAAISLSRN